MKSKIILFVIFFYLRGYSATTPVNLPTNIARLDNSYPKAVDSFNVSDVTCKELVCP